MIVVKDRLFRILIVAIPVLVVLYSNNVLSTMPNDNRMARIMVSIFCIVSVCEGCRYLIYKSREWFGKLRLLLVIPLGIAYVTTILSASALLRHYIFTGTWNVGIDMNSHVYINSKQLSFDLFGYSVINAVLFFFFFLAAYDLFYHYAKMRFTQREKERLEKEKLKAELQQLKGIVNPHFLFNNLNSLSSLISENPAEAEAFLDQLTKVFRYLLRNNDTELATLANELQFTHSYYHLLQTRYGNGISLDLKVDEAYESWLVPPMTLQLLLENAVKHNKLQKDNPLKIEIYSAPGNMLVVKNNINKKEGGVESTGIGLQSINARFKMLDRPGLTIKADNEYYTVMIPLVETEPVPGKVESFQARPVLG